MAPPSPREIYGTDEQHRGRIARFRVKRSRSMYRPGFQGSSNFVCDTHALLGKIRGGIAEVRESRTCR